VWSDASRCDVLATAITHPSALFCTRPLPLPPTLEPVDSVGDGGGGVSPAAAAATAALEAALSSLAPPAPPVAWARPGVRCHVLRVGYGGRSAAHPYDADPSSDPASRGRRCSSPMRGGEAARLAHLSGSGSAGGGGSAAAGGGPGAAAATPGAAAAAAAAAAGYRGETYYLHEGEGGASCYGSRKFLLAARWRTRRARPLALSLAFSLSLRASTARRRHGASHPRGAPHLPLIVLLNPSPKRLCPLTPPTPR